MNIKNGNNNNIALNYIDLNNIKLNHMRLKIKLNQIKITIQLIFMNKLIKITIII